MGKYIQIGNIATIVLLEEKAKIFSHSEIVITTWNSVFSFLLIFFSATV